VGEIKLSRFFFSALTLNFFLFGLVNAQSSVYCSAHDVRQMYEVLSHDSKICVNIDGMIGPVFFISFFLSPKAISKSGR
jgi:hypothetical protein